MFPVASLVREIIKYIPSLGPLLVDTSDIPLQQGLRLITGCHFLQLERLLSIFHYNKD